MNNQLRYPGVKPFTRADRELFFGRAEDIDKLGKLIRLEQLVVLYGKSGLGKSSLLNAGVIPLLEENAGYQCLQVRFGAYTPDKTAPLQKLQDAIETRGRGDGRNMEVLQEEHSLWKTLKKQQFAGQERLVLIFDQFEELFSYDKKAMKAFQHELAEVLYSDVPAEIRDWMEAQGDSLSDADRKALLQPLDIKVLFSIRSDRMSLLNQLSDFFPAVLKHCYELQPLSRKDAEDAILLPAYYQGEQHFDTPVFDYSDDALDSMLDFLTDEGKQQVEGFTLQVVCQHAEALVQQGAVAKQSEMPTLTPQALGNLQEVYASYYTKLVSGFGDEKTALMVRQLVEDALIFEEEQRRISLDEAVLTRSMGIPASILAKLIDSHLLRAEISSTGGRSYEISHDALVAPILQAKQERKELERKAKQQRQLILFSIVGLMLLALIGLGANYYIERQNQAMDEAYEELGEALGIDKAALAQLKKEKGSHSDQIKIIAEKASKTLDVVKQKDSLYKQMTQQVRITLEENPTRGGQASGVEQLLMQTLGQLEGKTQALDAEEQELKKLPLYSQGTPWLSTQNGDTEKKNDALQETASEPSQDTLSYSQGMPWLTQADDLLKKGNYQEAITTLEKALKEKPGDASLKAKLEEAKAQYHKAEGDRLYKAGDYAAALAAYEEALAAKPSDSYAKSRIKTCEAELSKLNKEEREEKFAEARTKADRLFDEKKYAEAKQAYEEALGYEPKDSYATQRVTACSQQIREQEERKEYETSLAKADKLMAEGKYADALALYRKLSGSPHANDALNAKMRDAQAKQQEDETATEADVKVDGNTYTVKGISFKMIGVQGGSFTMGSPESEVDRGSNETQHQVSLSGFQMGQFEVTQELYEAVMDKNPSKFSDCPKCPVENVSWNDAQAFIKKLNSLTGQRFRLPTEAEWEYAARAGTTTPFHTGNNITTSQANYNGDYPYNGNAKGQYRQKTTTVGSFAPNAWGLYDMSGNVWEWCQDWYGDYPSGSVTNPTGSSSGSYRVLRGGSWFSSALDCRVAYRSYDSPGYRDNYLGFRLAKTVSP